MKSGADVGSGGRTSEPQQTRPALRRGARSAVVGYELVKEVEIRRGTCGAAPSAAQQFYISGRRACVPRSACRAGESTSSRAIASHGTGRSKVQRLNDTHSPSSPEQVQAGYGRSSRIHSARVQSHHCSDRSLRSLRLFLRRAACHLRGDSYHRSALATTIITQMAATRTTTKMQRMPTIPTTMPTISRPGHVNVR